MKKIISSNIVFERREVTKEEAKKYLKITLIN